MKLLPTDKSKWKGLNDDDPLETQFIVLDIGCNAGNFTQLLYKFLSERTEKKVTILGIDIDSTLIKRANEQNAHRENVLYVTYDITDRTKDIFKGYLEKNNKKKFDAVFCMSITMWIHLNNGDDGLRQFLDRVHSLSALLIVEPQPWRCYQTAMRRLKRANISETFPLFENLQMKRTVESDIRRYIENQCRMEIVYESPPTKWNRKICFYTTKTA